MADNYKIGVSIALANHVSPALGIIMRPAWADASGMSKKGLPAGLCVVQAYDQRAAVDLPKQEIEKVEMSANEDRT